MVTAADSRLIEELDSRGLTATPTQLKRWRAARLLPTPERVSLGRGEGRRSQSYPPGTAEAAAGILAALASRVPLRQAALVLLVRAAPVEHNVVVASFQSLFDEIEAVLDTREDRDDAIDHFAQRFRRRARRNSRAHVWADRLGTQGARANSPFEDAAAAAFGAFFGASDESSEDSKKAMSTAYGVPPDVHEELHESLEGLSIPVLRNLVVDLSAEELLHARDLLGPLLDFAQRFLRANQNSGQPIYAPGFADLEASDDIDIAVGVLSLARILRDKPNLESDLVALVAQLEGVESAMRELLAQ